MSLAALRSAFADFCRRPVGDRPGDVVAAEQVELQRFLDQVRLECSRVAAELVDVVEPEEDGCESAMEWMARKCHLSQFEAGEEVRVGKNLEDLPEAARLMAEGRLGFGHLRLLARTAEVLNNSSTGAPFNEHDLLPLALKGIGLGRLRNLCQHYLHEKDPEGYARREKDGVEFRELFMRLQDDGMMRINGQLDALGGAAVRTALESLARFNGAGDDRSKPRRMADALVELAHHAMDNGTLPSQGGVRPHLQVTTSYETLKGMFGAPSADVEFGLPISGKAVERIACDCAVTSILFGADSAISDVSKAQRVARGSTRRAVRARDGGCRWPGCDRPASWTECHHTIHWINGGSTEVEILICLCNRHHWCVHEGGWQMALKEDGEPVFAPPPRLARGPTADAVA